MTSLTEEMVLQRTKCQNLEDVRSLNLWGTDLRDVSLLNRMRKSYNLVLLVPVTVGSLCLTFGSEISNYMHHCQHWGICSQIFSDPKFAPQPTSRSVSSA